MPWCSECGHEGSVDNPLVGDHIVSLAAGGSRFDPENLQTLCRECNRAKGAA